MLMTWTTATRNMYRLGRREVGADGVYQRRRREGPNIPEIRPCVSCGLERFEVLRMLGGVVIMDIYVTV